MKSNESAVRVDLKIDRDRYDFLAALAALRGKTTAELAYIFLANGLNHPPPTTDNREPNQARYFFTHGVESPQQPKKGRHEMSLLQKILGDRRSQNRAEIPAGLEYRVLEPPTLDKALRNFRVELAPGGSFDIYLARLMLDSSEKRSVGDEEITELPRYEDFCRSALVGVLREYLHNALAAKIERYLADAYVRIREVGDPHHIAAEREVAGILSIPADSPLNAELAAKRTGDTDNAAANGDNGGKERSGK